MNLNAILLWLFLAWVALAVVDMWIDLVSGATFVKITVTIGLLMAGAVGVWIAKRSTDD